MSQASTSARAGAADSNEDVPATPRSPSRRLTRRRFLGGAALGAGALGAGGLVAWRRLGQGPPPLTVVGAHVNAAPDERRRAFTDLERSLGRPLRADRQYHHWDEAWPDDYDLWTMGEGRLLVASVSRRRADGRRDGWADVAEGRYDTRIAGWAAGCAGLGRRLVVVLGHEPEDDPGDPAEYRAAWRRFATIFRREAPDVRLCWIPTAETFRLGRAERWYPGDDACDLVGADGYNWAHVRPGAQWTSFPAVFDAAFDWAAAREKRFVAAEFGCAEDPSDPERRAAWLLEAVASLEERRPAVEAACYWNVVDDGADWRVETSPQVRRVFADLAARSARV